MAKLTISQNDYESLRNSGMSQQDIVSKYSEKPLTLGSAISGFGKNIMTGAQAITDFVGARGIADQYGSSLARTGLNLSGNKESAKLVGNPSLGKVVGSAIQTGANFIPGVGTEASLLTKAAIGLGTGYAFDVGKNLQQGRAVIDAFKPGIGTVIGGALPIIGKILGYTTKNLPAKLAQKLEDTNLRLTPVERQNLAKKGQDIVNYLANKRVIGSPASRYAKLDSLYNQMEDKVSAQIAKKNTLYFKDEIIREISKIPDAFANDPELQSEAITTTERLIKNLQARNSTTLTGQVVNDFKRNYMKRAFAKNATDVISESRLAIAATLNGQLRSKVKGLEALNEEYGIIIASRRALQKALSRPQIGLTGKIAGIAAGSAVGSVLSPGIGTATGAIVGPTIGKAIAGTRVRSTIGAGAQTIANIAQKISSLQTDKFGNISQKAVLNLLESLKQ